MYNGQQFQWLMFRPLYMFGNNTNTSVLINYPLSPANPPMYSNGGKTVTVTMKGWKWSNGEAVDAKSVMFYLNMVEAEKANWYAYSKGLLPDNIVSYKATILTRWSSSWTGPIRACGSPTTSWLSYTRCRCRGTSPSWRQARQRRLYHRHGRDNSAKRKAASTFLTAQSKQAGSYASSPLW